MSGIRQPQSAILLMGPTGAGKTPLGAFLEERGLWGRRCVHLDFGAELRSVAAGGGAGVSLSAGDVAEVRAALAGNRLLEDRQFPIARAIVEDVLVRRAVGVRDLVVLNGLPRHEGQAEGVAPLLRVVLVVDLACTAEVVRARIKTDAGGDRAGRRDDAPEEVTRKLALYEARTAPLLAYYRKKGVSLRTVPVSLCTQLEDVWRALEAFSLTEPGSRGG
ncbi:MAG: nucleoside monophosphate kinase [Lentisphaerae bacterium]|nr:nucleoside monophosphate kinase [Lentisphaerota bacterium]